MLDAPLLHGTCRPPGDKGLSGIEAGALGPRYSRQEVHNDGFPKVGWYLAS